MKRVPCCKTTAYNIFYHTNDTERLYPQEEKEQESQDQQLNDLLQGLRGLHYRWGGSSLPEENQSCHYQAQHDVADDRFSNAGSCMVTDGAMQDDPVQMAALHQIFLFDSLGGNTESDML